MPMTAECHTLIDPKDVLAIELECKLCHTRIAYKLEKLQVDRLSSRVLCPNCREDLIRPDDEGPDMRRIANFLDALKLLIQTESRAIIHLEINCEPE